MAYPLILSYYAKKHQTTTMPNKKMPSPKKKQEYFAYAFMAGFAALIVGVFLAELISFYQEQPSPNTALESEPILPEGKEDPLLYEGEASDETESSYIEEIEPERVEPARPIEQFTKGGYVATVSEESLDLLIRAANNEEYGLIENMLISGVAIQLKDGVRVVDTRCGGAFCSRLTFRFPDNPTVYHTINEAID